MVKRRYFDNTMLSGYKKCPRFYFLRHMRGWRKDGTGAALVFGSSWHAAQDVIWKHYKNLSLRELVEAAKMGFDAKWEEEGFTLELSVEALEQLGMRNPMVAKEMIANYIADREGILKEAEILAIEQPFAVPLPIDNSSEVSVWYVGRLDKVIDHNGKKVIEHKTTSEYAKASGFKTGYVESWYLDSQVMGYLYGAGLYYSGLEQVWIDAALVHKTVHDKFRFIPVGHQWGMLESWIQDTKEWAARILRDESRFAEQGSLAGGVFPKQQDSCVGKYGPCPMLDLCRTQANPEKLAEPPAGYIVERWEPFEVLKLDQLFKE